MAVCNNDIDDQNKINNFESCESNSQNNNDCTLPAEGHFGVICNSQQQTPDLSVTTVPAELQLEVHSDSQQQQQHDQDVAVVPAEQQLEVHSDKQLQQQHDNDIAVVPAEQQLEVQCDRQQQHDKDVAVIPAEQQLKVLSDRQQQQQHDNNFAVVPAEQQLEVQSDRLQQQQPDSVLANHRVRGTPPRKWQWPSRYNQTSSCLIVSTHQNEYLQVFKKLPK